MDVFDEIGSSRPFPLLSTIQGLLQLHGDQSDLKNDIYYTCNIVLYVVLRIHLVRKFRTSYSIYLEDANGNKQTLANTIASLIEQNEMKDKKICILLEKWKNNGCQ